LLRKVLVYRADAIPGLRSGAVHDYVYKHVFTSDGTSKETSAARFRDLDRIACTIIREHKLDAIHDIGVSSGVTSLTLYHALAATGLSPSFCISDKYAVYGRVGSCPVRIIDAQGSVRELYFCGILGKREDVSMKFPITRFLYWLLAGRTNSEPVRWFGLFDYEVQQAIRNGTLRNIDYDVFVTRLPDAFSFVRCMNLLNANYFPLESIETALGNVVESLREGGVLQIGRTHEDGTNHAGFYEKHGGRLELLQEVGSGTELRATIARLFGC
jgi:hypothetical protein